MIAGKVGKRSIQMNYCNVRKMFSYVYVCYVVMLLNNVHAKLVNWTGGEPGRTHSKHFPFDNGGIHCISHHIIVTG